MAQPSASDSVETSPNHVVRLDAVSALVEWAGPDEQIIRLGDSLSSSPVSLDLSFDSTAKLVSLRLRIVVQIHRDSSNKTPLYLHIGPEDIETIVCPGPKHEPTASTGTCFEVRLRRAVALIGPPFRLRPSNKARASVVNNARALAAKREFSVYIQDGLLSDYQCKALHTAVYNEYSSSGRLDLASLYGGLGGKQLLARESDTSSTPDDGAEAPPAYDEVEAPPPMAPLWQGKIEFPLTQLACAKG